MGESRANRIIQGPWRHGNLLCTMAARKTNFLKPVIKEWMPAEWLVQHNVEAFPWGSQDIRASLSTVAENSLTTGAIDRSRRAMLAYIDHIFLSCLRIWGQRKSGLVELGYDATLGKAGAGAVRRWPGQVGGPEEQF
jgi:hypothetical protein